MLVEVILCCVGWNYERVKSAKNYTYCLLRPCYECNFSPLRHP